MLVWCLPAAFPALFPIDQFTLSSHHVCWFQTQNLLKKLESEAAPVNGVDIEPPVADEPSNSPRETPSSPRDNSPAAATAGSSSSADDGASATTDPARDPTDPSDTAAAARASDPSSDPASSPGPAPSRKTSRPAASRGRGKGGRRAGTKRSRPVQPMPDEMRDSAELQKYWYQRYRLFSR